MRNLSGVLAIAGGLWCLNADSAQRSRPVKILLFHGGRPWTAKDVARTLKTAGGEVRLVDSAGLAGLGGASIKTFLTDPIEPAPRDEITPELARLAQYDVVIAGAMLSADQTRFFTAERIARLRDYLLQGGALLVAENVPKSLGELLPVTFHGTESAKPTDLSCLAESSVFSGLPKEWPYFGRRRIVQAKPGATVLARMIVNDRDAGPYIARLAVGKGKVYYWNSEWRQTGGFRQLRYWAYFGSIMTRLINDATGGGLDADKAVYQPLPTPPVRPLAAAAAAVAPPRCEEAVDGAKPVVTETDDSLSIAFPNGVELRLTKGTCALRASYPGLAEPVIRDLRLPTVVGDVAIGEKWDKDSAEAVAVGKAKTKEAVLPISYQYERWTLNNAGRVVMHLRAALPGAEPFAVRWELAPIRLRLDERDYVGFGDRVELDGPKRRLSSLLFRTRMALGATVAQHQAWRMGCYSQPRGFAAIEFDPARSQTTSRWQQFGTGQPFNYVFSPAGSYCEFLDTPQVNTVEIRHDADAPSLCSHNKILLGLVAPPVRTPFLWRVVSTGAVRDANPWLTWYQYLRERYCRKTGIEPAQPLPTATHLNTCTKAQIQDNIQTAARMGFRRYVLPLCPSALESLVNPKVAAVYRQIATAGMAPRPWSAGNYTQGLANPTAQSHPEWLVYDRAGKPYQYFGCHPVFDVHHPDYLRHYFSVVDKAIELGMRDIYMDMGGARASVVNYRSDDPLPGLSAQTEIYRHFRKRGVSVGIEGQNALVLDNFWYRQRLYASHAGNEFAFVGMSILTNPPDHLSMDYFRLVMHNAFFQCTISGYVCDMETVPRERERTAEMGAINHMANEALAVVGRPWVRQTEFGTSWSSERGAALFIWHPTRRLSLTLPAGWQIRKVLTLDGPHRDFTTAEATDLAHKCVVIVY